jgi:ribose-phosphate pyrophosphokinase
MQVKAEVVAIAEYASSVQPPNAGRCAMTTLAMLSPPLERLFDRIDAAEPTDPYLRVLLDIWRTKRLRRFLPTRTELVGAAPEPIAGHTFSFVHAGPTTDDWALVDVGEAARSILGPIGGDRRLMDMRSRRLAVHLRRLFDFVRETAEPITASFSERGMPFSDNRFEVMVAPLASDGRRVDAVFGGIVARPMTRAADRGRGGHPSRAS